jgi:hypothetical protein
VAIALLASAAACGSSGEIPHTSDNSQLSPDQLVRKSAAAVYSAFSVHVVSRKPTPAGEETIDARMNQYSGSATIRFHDQVIRLRIVNRDEYYLQGNDAFWASKAPAGRLRETLRNAHGSWFHASDGHPIYADLFEAVQFENVVYAFGQVPTGADYEQSPSKQVHGVAAVSATDPRDNGGTIFVPEKGSALPLRAVLANGAVFDFYDWNAHLAIAPPPANKVLELPAS